MPMMRCTVWSVRLFCFRLLADAVKRTELVSAGSLYLSTALYKMSWDLQPFDSALDSSIFNVPAPAYIPLGDAVLMVSELLYSDKVRQDAGAGRPGCDLSEEALQGRFPALYNSLLEVIRNTETNIAKYLD